MKSSDGSREELGFEERKMIEEMNSVDHNDALESFITVKESNLMVEKNMKLIKQN